MQSKDIRKNWINFFKDKKGHLHLPSASLVPNNPTLLLTNAGMVPFVPYFLGKEKPPASRAVTVQKCVRVGGKDSDLENIGRTARHLTFFEMLGNFSFGDYFKEDVIPWTWELLTEVYGFKPEELIVSVFEGDDASGSGRLEHKVGFDQEAFDIWHKKVGVPESCIIKLGRADNFWGPPGGISGPCGPCSEIYYAPADGSEPIEIWNLVFMQYEKFEDGSLQPLPKQNVDTGAGLERIATILQNKQTVFETDLLQPFIEAIYKKDLSNVDGNKQKYEYKVIADHLRCICMLIADGIKPSNVGRGYILRMLIRRAARFLYRLGFTPNKLGLVCSIPRNLSEIFGGTYPELNTNLNQIENTIGEESEAFFDNLMKGQVNFGFLADKVEWRSDKTIKGEEAFDLYATYGFPIEITLDLAEERGLKVDLEGYEKAKRAHSEVSNQGKFAVGFKAERNEELKDLPATEFIYKHSSELENIRSYPRKLREYVGTPYHSNELEKAKKQDCISKVLYVDENSIVLDKTLFYPEGGGQISDIGIIHTTNWSKELEEELRKSSDEDFPLRTDVIVGSGIGFNVHKIILKDEIPWLNHLFNVTDVQKTGNNQIVHYGQWTSPLRFQVGEEVICNVAIKERRSELEKHHTATHLLHAALRQVTNNEAEQRGSLVAPDRLRFDFACSKKLADKDLEKIENWINEVIKQNCEVKHQEMTMEEAMKEGALAFFGDKYGDSVKVLSILPQENRDISQTPPLGGWGAISTEFCGGTHVQNTSEIQGFKIISESAISSGVRRIEAVAGQAYIDYLAESDKQLDAMKHELKVPREKVAERVKDLLESDKQKDKKISELEKQLVKFKSEDLLSQIIDKNGIKVLVAETDLTALKDALDYISTKIQGEYILFLASKAGVKISYAAKSSGEFKKEMPMTHPLRNARDLIDQFASLIGGSGGGRPDFAQGGGGDEAKFHSALTQMKNNLL